MDLTFREKSLWLVLLSLMVVFGVYFSMAMAHPSDEVTAAQVSTFIGMLVVLVVIQIVGHTLLAIASRRELAHGIQSDERDVLIRLKSSRFASYLLVLGVFCSLCFGVIVPGNFVFVHLLLAFWVLAQVVEIVAQLLYYRGVLRCG